MRPPGLIVSVECRSLLPNYHILNRLNEPYIKRALSRYSIFSSGETGGGGEGLGGWRAGWYLKLLISVTSCKSKRLNRSLLIQTGAFSRRHSSF